MTDSLGNTTELRIQQVKKYVTIFDVLRTMGLDYEEATQQVRCPFHEDNSPSARIYADDNKIYCFTEGKSWDVIDAVETIQRCTRHEAIAWLEQQFNVPGVLQTLSGTIRARLTTPVAPNIRETAELVESRLRQERGRLGFARYTRMLMALDLSVWECGARKITGAQFTVRMGQLLKAMQG
jgi:DNA primase